MSFYMQIFSTQNNLHPKKLISEIFFVWPIHFYVMKKKLVENETKMMYNVDRLMVKQVPGNAR